MEAALYGEGGFFAEGGGAGRAGRDFITSPEVGSLFGACVARALDGWWRELGAPDPFLVVEAGARVLVAGSSIYGVSDGVATAMSRLRDLGGGR